MPIVEEVRLTTWYTWKCPRKRCRTRLEATVRGYVEANATRHLERHQRLDTRPKGFLDAARLARLEGQGS